MGLLASPERPHPHAHEARAHPLAWAPSPDEGPDLLTTFQIPEDLLCKERTWAVRRRLALQEEDLLYKEETCSTRK